MTKTYFKIVLTLSWLLGVIGLFVDTFTEHTLPIVLQDYVKTQYQSSDIISVSLGGLGFIIIVALIISYIGLYLWKHWSRPLFVSIFIVSYLLTPFYTEPIVETIWATNIYSLTYIFIGILIGMMYFSDEIKQKFKNSSNEE